MYMYSIFITYVFTMFGPKFDVFFIIFMEQLLLCSNLCIFDILVIDLYNEAFNCCFNFINVCCVCMCLLGRRVKKRVEEYEYDEASEQLYRLSMLKQFNKTLSDGFFNVIVVDDINNKVCVHVHWNLSYVKLFI